MGSLVDQADCGLTPVYDCVNQIGYIVFPVFSIIFVIIGIIINRKFTARRAIVSVGPGVF